MNDVVGRYEKPIRVKIIKCDEPLSWYAQLIGESFLVYSWGRDYVLKEDMDIGFNAMWRHILKEDAVIIST